MLSPARRRHAAVTQLHPSWSYLTLFSLTGSTKCMLEAASLPGLTANSVRLGPTTKSQMRLGWIKNKTRIMAFQHFLGQLLNNIREVFLLKTTIKNWFIVSLDEIGLCNIKHRESSYHSSYSQVNWTQHSKGFFFLLVRVFCCTSFHWLLSVVIYSTQNSVQHIRRAQPPLPSAPKGLALKP